MLPIFYSDTRQNIAKDIRSALQCAPASASSHKGEEVVSLISGIGKKEKRLAPPLTREGSPKTLLRHVHAFHIQIYMSGFERP